MVNRIVLGVAVVAALGAAFVADRARVGRDARKAAIQQCGQEYDLAATQAELRALRAQLSARVRAQHQLQERVQVARREARRLALELEAYKRETQINPDGVVDADLLRRLRAN